MSGQVGPRAARSRQAHRMNDEALHKLALQSDRVIALSEAPLLGMSRDALSQHARRHGWQRPYPGVIIMPGTPMTFVRALLVAVKAAGGKRVLVGGPYVSTCVEPLRDVDHTFIGEAELTLPQFLRDLVAGCPQAVYTATEKP